MIEVYQPMAEEKKQRFTPDIASGLRVRGDRELLAQMVANIIENAMKHSPAGASIDLVTIESPGAITVAVTDSGPGIPTEERARVFQRFYRLENSRSTPGSGLGLSLVEAIAALHQVHVELSDNSPGLRVVLRFFATDQGTVGGDSLTEHQTQGEPRAIRVGAPAVYSRSGPAACPVHLTHWRQGLASSR